ncbi:ATP-binding protein [Streptomyces yaanensis]|uniref:histidine kinase n=1 Tax=Streptomyces yaanensis TaxID=1142239 RepID=A0ABV7S899_9ACTN|nr:ATP-binding protein [Streptomyces sp. CGMCC 4.7035]WNC02569.1 ATP-binding protein [Streptomyces sp. CGMCC 4.7035]
MTAPIPSGERPALRAVAPVTLATAVVAGLAVAAAVMAAPEGIRVPLAWEGAAAALLLCGAVALAAHGIRSASLARRRLDAMTQDAGRLVQERARLAEEFSQERARLTDGFIEERVRLTEEFERERARLAKEFAQERVRLSDEFDQERIALIEGFAGERDVLTGELTRLAEETTSLARRLRQASNARDAAVSVTANVAGRMQALATGMLADLRAMEDKHADEDVLADLLHLDHRTAQAGRLADSVAVLAGARSGRRWARPIVMESILRGAMGRVSGYQRVRVHSSSEAAVAGHAAEGVMHALAELLDNAANFSPPTAEVHVYVEEVPSGVIVSVEDAGLVMGDVQLRRAERAVSGEVAEMGGLTGTRLGLAVVGRLARKYGLKVSFRPSARGGTGVLMLIPQDILSQPTLPPSAEPVTPDSEPTLTLTAVAALIPSTETAPAPSTETAPAPAPADETASAAPEHRPSYAAARAAEDLDPDPVPTHEFPVSGTPGTGGLPRRRRGHALEAAERSRARAAARAEREPDTPDDTKARAARFSSFRQAVRGTVPDQATVQGTTAEPEAVREDAARTAPDSPVRDTPARDTAHEPLVRHESPVRQAADEPVVRETPAPRPVPDDPTAPEPAVTPSHPEGNTTS